MSPLDWIGKNAAVNHYNEVPFHLLKETPDLSFGDPEAGNLIVEGDNLVALKALLHQFLREDGAIFISIDDNEVRRLRYLLDEIFGRENLEAHSAAGSR